MKFIKIYFLLLSTIVSVGFCSIFLQHKVILKTQKATSFEVVCGNIFMDYSTDSINNNQMYVMEKNSESLFNCINRNTMSFSYYFIVSGNIKEYKVSDSEGVYNPVIEIENWTKISNIYVFIYALIALAIPFFLYFVKYLLKIKRRV